MRFGISEKENAVQYSLEQRRNETVVIARIRFASMQEILNFINIFNDVVMPFTYIWHEVEPPKLSIEDGNVVKISKSFSADNEREYARKLMRARKKLENVIGEALKRYAAEYGLHEQYLKAKLRD
ncbi:MAG: hypothetical protein QW644_01210 [Candidatus Micrarchaeaceae archaeon]